MGCRTGWGRKYSSKTINCCAFGIFNKFTSFLSQSLGVLQYQMYIANLYSQLAISTTWSCWGFELCSGSKRGWACINIHELCSGSKRDWACINIHALHAPWYPCRTPQACTYSHVTTKRDLLKQSGHMENTRLHTKWLLRWVPLPSLAEIRQVSIPDPIWMIYLVTSGWGRYRAWPDSCCSFYYISSPPEFSYFLMRDCGMQGLPTASWFREQAIIGMGNSYSHDDARLAGCRSEELFQKE